MLGAPGSASPTCSRRGGVRAHHEGAARGAARPLRRLARRSGRGARCASWTRCPRLPPRAGRTATARSSGRSTRARGRWAGGPPRTWAPAAIARSAAAMRRPPSPARARGRLLPPGHEERPELVRRLGAALIDVGELERATGAFRDALAAARALPDVRTEWRAAVDAALLGLSVDPREVEAAGELAETAIVEAGHLGDDLGLARAWRLVSLVKTFAAETAGVQRALEQALVHARAAGERREEAEIEGQLLTALTYGARPWTRGSARLEEHLANARERGSPLRGGPRPPRARGPSCHGGRVRRGARARGRGLRAGRGSRLDSRAREHRMGDRGGRAPGGRRRRGPRAAPGGVRAPPGDGRAELPVDGGGDARARRVRARKRRGGAAPRRRERGRRRAERRVLAGPVAKRPRARPRAAGRLGGGGDPRSGRARAGRGDRLARVPGGRPAPSRQGAHRRPRPPRRHGRRSRWRRPRASRPPPPGPGPSASPSASTAASASPEVARTRPDPSSSEPRRTPRE